MKTDKNKKNKKNISQPNKISKIKCFGQAIKVTWLQFSERTSIHGVQYISDPQGNIFTRFVWIVITLVCFAISNILVSIMVERYQSNPTRVNVESNFAPLHEISYPAITFCPSNYVTIKKVETFVRSLKFPENVSIEEVLPTFDQVVGFHERVLYDPYELDLIQEILTMNRYDTPSAMSELKSSCKELLFRCRFEGKIQDCGKLFRKSLTFNGYCCSFNLADYRKGGYEPISPSLYGIGKGLSFIVKPDKDSMSMSKIYSEGIQLLIHDSFSYPGESSIQRVLPFRTESLVSIKTTLTFCSNQVKSLPIKDRGCVFPEELNLKYFKVSYKEANCDIECRIDKTNALCECIPFYFPNYENFPICNFTKIECLVENYYLLHEFNMNGSLSVQCNCPANCNNILYDVIADTHPINDAVNFSIDPFYKGVNKSYVIVHVFMDSQVYRKMRRDLLTNIVGLVSNFGGVYSLFLGMSVIGFIEVIYFPTIRLYKNYKTITKNEIRKPIIKIDGVEARFSSDGKNKLKSKSDLVNVHM